MLAKALSLVAGLLCTILVCSFNVQKVFENHEESLKCLTLFVAPESVDSCPEFAVTISISFTFSAWEEISWQLLCSRTKVDFLVLFCCFQFSHEAGNLVHENLRMLSKHFLTSKNLQLRNHSLVCLRGRFVSSASMINTNKGQGCLQKQDIPTYGVEIT